CLLLGHGGISNLRESSIVRSAEAYEKGECSRHTPCAVAFFGPDGTRSVPATLLRREDHHDSSPLHLRRLLEFGHGFQLFLQALDELVAFVDVGVLAAAEDDGEDDL